MCNDMYNFKVISINLAHIKAENFIQKLRRKKLEVLNDLS